MVPPLEIPSRQLGSKETRVGTVTVVTATTNGAAAWKSFDY
jgi:hypothetical protein